MEAVGGSVLFTTLVVVFSFLIIHHLRKLLISKPIKQSQVLSRKGGTNMEAVGGSVLSTTLQVVFDRIAINENFLLGLFPGNKKLQLKRLERVLQIVSQVLQDAENKQDKSPAVKSWFNSIKHAVYQAEDVLDEINTDHLRIQVQHSKGNFSDIDFSEQFIGELSPRLDEICEALERKVQRIGMLGLEIFHGKQKREDKMPTTSVVKQSQICGRDDEKEKIIQMVLSSGKGGTAISVIPIIGMGGIGKTTLAQLVYNDERVKNHFKTRAWSCVSEEFDVYRVTKELLMEVNSSIVDKEDDLNRLQVKLKENLEAKRFIIILDDIWHDNYADYQGLMTPLKSGSRGSKIIITTRNENIASMLTNEPFYRLKPISDDESWSLFKLHAFDNRPRTFSDKFVTIGKMMVKKCKGLPLAIKTVAGALRSKEDIREWRDMLSNDNWMVEGDILPALSLSFKLLPSHLKCCFAFCAVFPKDKPFDKEQVALLWMASDLVQPSSQKVAQDYFEELRARSFFEMGNNEEYVMHDLINDLARHVSGYFCARMEDCQSKDVHQGIQVEYVLPPEVLHISFTRETSQDDTLKRLRGLAQVQGIRTFLSNQNWYGDIEIFFTDILPKLRHIRALSLQYLKISVIPDSIGDLKQLRLLDLTWNHIKKLPNGITKCVNLQTLILKDCYSLKELPEDMGLLINLQHLDITGVNIDKIRLNKLKDIQNLCIVVDWVHGNALEQLDKLQLGQSLEISELGNAVTVEMAKKAELKNKNCIQELKFEWQYSSWYQKCLPFFLQRNDQHLKILAELRPHTNIRELWISGYRGTAFPNWVGDSSFCNLEKLTLTNCRNCIRLPPLGQLTGLKRLHLHGISEIGEEFYGSSSNSKPFPNLEVFTISYCKKLKSLPEQMHTQLSSLRELQIWDCPEIKCFPNGGLPPSLETLRIWDCKKLMKFPRNWGLQTLPSLKELSVGGIKEKSFPEEGLLPATLKELSIHDCGNLEALNPKGFQDITSLEELFIWNCRELRCLPEEGLPSSLSSLGISGCLKLEGRLEREKGEDWPKVERIPTIKVYRRWI